MSQDLTDLLPPSSRNRLIRLQSAYECAANWEFLKVAMEQLNVPRRANAQYTPESFFIMLTKTIALDADGVVGILTSKNGKPLGFGCAFKGTHFEGVECFYVWQTYSSGKCPTTLTDLQYACEQYAKSIGQKTIKISTPRLTRSADRLFEGTLGYRKERYEYSKDIS